jgi:hypothetical protein
VTHDIRYGGGEGEMSDPEEPTVGVLHHIIRPTFPWRERDGEITECGHPASGLPAISGEEAVAWAKKLGAARFAFVTCQTCVQTLERHAHYRVGGPTEVMTWDREPRAIMLREAERVGWRAQEDDAARLDRELRAIAALVESHREEFDGYVAGLADTNSLDARRAGKQWSKQARR